MNRAGEDMKQNVVPFAVTMEKHRENGLVVGWRSAFTILIYSTMRPDTGYVDALPKLLFCA